MKFNASKFHVMSIHRGKIQSPFLYKLCGTFLSSVTDERYLGVLISQDLSWTSHISCVASSASQKLGFLMRNLKGSPKDLKRLAYISMVRSSLEYASTIWDPYQQNQKSLLERTQRKAARWICNDFSQRSSVTHMLESLNLEPLEERRRMSRLVFLYKILHEQVAVPADEIGLCRNPRAARGLVTQDKLHVPRCSTTELQQHFVARTIPQWNRLLNSVTSADSVQTFKSQLMGEVLP